MYYVVLLGNPGEDYEDTRHNVAWYLVDKNFLKDFFASKGEIDHFLNARTAVGRLGNKPVTFVWPETFMNRSGETVAKCISPAAGELLVVVHDDIDLPLGEVRVAFDRGDGGHNGIRSIIEWLGTRAFVRIRVGIGKTSWLTGRLLPRPSGEDLNRYVLGRLTSRDKTALQSVRVALPAIVKITIGEGYRVAMNKYN